MMMQNKKSLREKLLLFFLGAARLPIVKPLVTFFFTHMNDFLPYDRLIDGIYWQAFHHPKPVHPLHILILPKTSIPTLSLAPKNNSDLYTDLFRVVHELIEKFDLEESGYRLITNGGSYQSLPQWHWHLISENH